ncbi:competence type IV pilus minor pilin ComGG [Salipaludibacillus sp. HK11]|uniref:competence type IV pilus minor pilin ComGG n=1 Tax=Salipaludibacillus sp. HK11 TaxID=3394320 RepID=UPI0039FC1365
MNEKGVILLLVLIMIMFISMFTIHIAALYQQEKQFLGLEKEQLRLDQLLLNGKIEIIHMVDDATTEIGFSGKLSYPEGVIIYEVRTEENIFLISMIGKTDHSHAKQASFTYNRDTKTLNQWREGFLWN